MDHSERLARRSGYGVNEVRDRLNAGLLWCHRDQDWEPADDFDPLPGPIPVRRSSCRRSLGGA